MYFKNPSKPTRSEKVRVLTAAKRLMDTKGWVDGGADCDTGPYCVGEAVAFVITGHVHDMWIKGSSFLDNQHYEHPAIPALFEELAKGREHGYNPLPHQKVYALNDKNGMTKESIFEWVDDVILRLNKEMRKA